MGFGTTELVIILAIIVLLFGAKKIPDLASGLGKGIKSFKKAVNDDEEVAKNTQVEEKTTQATTTEKKPEETTKA